MLYMLVLEKQLELINTTVILLILATLLLREVFEFNHICQLL